MLLPKFPHPSRNTQSNHITELRDDRPADGKYGYRTLPHLQGLQRSCSAFVRGHSFAHHLHSHYVVVLTSAHIEALHVVMECAPCDVRYHSFAHQLPSHYGVVHTSAHLDTLNVGMGSAPCDVRYREFRPQSKFLQHSHVAFYQSKSS